MTWSECLGVKILQEVDIIRNENTGESVKVFKNVYFCRSETLKESYFMGFCFFFWHSFNLILAYLQWLLADFILVVA